MPAWFNQSSDSQKLWVLIAIIAMAGILPWYIECKRGVFDLFSTKNIFIVYLLMQFVVWPAWVILGSQRWAGSVPITFLNIRITPAVHGTMCVIGGLLTFYAGYYFMRIRGKRKPRQIRLLETHRSRLMFVTTILVTLSVSSFFYLISSEGGLLPFLLRMDEFRNNNLLGTGYLFFGMNLLYTAFLAVYGTHAKQRAHKGLSAALFLASILIGFLGAYRHMAIETIASWFVIRHYIYKRFALNWKLCVAIVGVILLNVMYVSLRSTGGDAFGLFRSVSSLNDLFYNGLFARFHGTESMARIVQETEVSGYTGGGYLATNLAVFWIPRGLWPEKPATFSAAVNVRFFPESFNDISKTGSAIPSLAGSFYWIGGVIGVLVGMLLIGVLLGGADNIIQWRQDLAGIGVYVQIFIFAFYVNETLDLHLMNLLFRITVWALVCALCGVTRVRVRRAER